MSEYLGSQREKQEILKNIIKGLHEGKSVDEVKAEFQRLVKDVDATEIASMEQALIAEGMPPEAITKLCDVHATVFREALTENKRPDLVPGHPLFQLSHDNQELQQELERITQLIASTEPDTQQSLSELLSKLDKHYARKENILFPYLEKHGVTGPPAVMWSVDDEIRSSLKQLLSTDSEPGDTWVGVRQQIQEMIFKENNILTPMLLDLLTETEWAEIKQEFSEYGTVFSLPHGDFWEPTAAADLKPSGIGSHGEIQLDTGRLTPQEINNLLTNLPVDITLVDKNDVVRYFSATADRIFVRTKAIIGRRVQNCHPPDSVHVVEKILSDFKSGRHSHADFWLQMNGQFIYIRYLALRSPEGEYLGTIEVTQDITEIKKLEGDRRLLTYDE